MITVLVVDQQRMFAESLGKTLDQEPDIEVVALALSGGEALSKVAHLHPQVVLVGYELPDLDGATLTVRIKKIDTGIIVVMLTSSTEDQVFLDAIDAGCSGLIGKDQAIAEVADAIRAVAAGEALISPAQLALLLPKLQVAQPKFGSDLTPREWEILGLVMRGCTNQDIGDELHLSVNTVRNYVQSILRKLGVHSKLEAAAVAVRRGVMEYPRR